MKPLLSVVDENIIWHELGHVFTAILLKKIGLEYKQIIGIYFYRNHPKNENRMGEVKGTSIANQVTDKILDELIKMKELILPCIIGYLSGYIFETLFDKSKSFEQKYTNNNHPQVTIDRACK